MREQRLHVGTARTLWRQYGGMVGLFLIGWLVLNLPVRAQDRPWETIAYPPLNDVLVPEIDTRKLDNGATLHAMEDRALPLITLNVLARGGRFLVSEERAGLEQLMEEGLMAGGTERLGPDPFRTLLEGRAVTLSVSTGVTTTRIRMQFLKEDLDTMAPLLVELLRSPGYPESELNRAKMQAETQVSRQNEDAVEIARREFRKLLYGEASVLARVPSYESLNGLNREHVVELHREIFRAPNLQVGISGDIDRSEGIALLEDLFGDLPGGVPTEIDLQIRARESSDGVIHFAPKRDINQSTVFMGHYGGRQSDDDLAEQELFNQILGGGFSGRLFRQVRSEKGLAYAVFGSYGSQVHYPGIFAAGVLTRSGSTVDAIRAVEEEIRRMRTEPVPEPERQEAVQRYLNQAVFEYENRESQLLERMGNRLDGLPDRWSERLLEDVPEVSSGELLEMAQRRIHPDQWVILVVGNPDELGDALESLGPVEQLDISIPELEP